MQLDFAYKDTAVILTCTRLDGHEIRHFRVQANDQSASVWRRVAREMCAWQSRKRRQGSGLWGDFFCIPVEGWRLKSQQFFLCRPEGMQVSGLIGVTLLHHCDVFVDSSSQGSISKRESKPVKHESGSDFFGVDHQKNTKLMTYNATCFKDVQEQGLFLKARRNY